MSRPRKFEFLVGAEKRGSKKSSPVSTQGGSGTRWNVLPSP